MKGSSIIQAFYSQDFSQFEASWILKVTWTDMSLFADKSQVREIYKCALHIEKVSYAS